MPFAAVVASSFYNHKRKEAQLTPRTMYKFLVSCYYWRAVEDGLRLRTLTITRRFEESGHGLGYTTIERLTRLDKLASSIERRSARRLRVKCEVELVANLSLLDSDVQNPESSLVFFGSTHDLSTSGMGFVLPATTIDQRFCTGSNRLNISLHVPGGVIGLEVTPVRCEQLTGLYSAQACLLGTKITGVTNPDRFERYLESLNSDHRLHQ